MPGVRLWIHNVFTEFGLSGVQIPGKEPCEKHRLHHRDLDSGSFADIQGRNCQDIPRQLQLVSGLPHGEETVESTYEPVHC